MTTDSEEGLSDPEEGLVNFIRKAVRKEMKKAEAEGATKPVMKRMRREIKEMKQEIKVIKSLIGATSTQDASPADWNVNPRTSHDQITRSEEPRLQLVFVSKLHNTIFTKDKIRDENGSCVEIKLIDTNSMKSVDAGDRSSIEIEIVVLEGDFGSEGNENWTKQDFDAEIVSKRKDKGPLLVKGKQEIRLKNGVGIIDDLSFSDNSNRSWTKCGKFRLGARVLQRTSRGKTRIKEARSEAFKVRHQRGKRSHLDKIKEGGKFYEALIENNIRTEGDLKQMYKTNRDKLREILKGCSKWEWDAIVQHASSVVDDEAYNSTATIGPPLPQFLPVNKGSTGTQNDSNRPSSSTPYESAFPPENVQHVTPQPPAMSTALSQGDVQLEHFSAAHDQNILLTPNYDFDNQALPWQSWHEN